MKAHAYNFGLNGQPVHDYAFTSADEYDHFICLSKKCRERRARRRKLRHERRKARLEKKRLKNELMRADVEAKRAETRLATQLGGLGSPAKATKASQQAASSAGGRPHVQKAGFGGGTVMIVVGVLLAGGLLWQQAQKNKAAPVAQAV